MTYRIEFERIGRTRAVAPLTGVAESDVDIAEAVYRHARPHLRSREVVVAVDLEEMRGTIICGFHSGGTFTIHKEVSAGQRTAAAG